MTSSLFSMIKFYKVLTSESTILDFKQEFKSHCLLIKIKVCIRDSRKEIINPEDFSR